MANSESKFGDVRALSGEHKPRGSVVHRQNELSQLTTGLYRPPHLRIDVVKGVEGGCKRRGVVIKTQHLHCAPHIGGVPTLELMTPLGWAQEAC